METDGQLDAVRQDEVVSHAAVQNRESAALARLTPEAVRTLHETYGRELLAFLTGVLRDSAAAMDVSQMTFRCVLEQGHTAHAATIKGWLFKVAMNEALVYRRQGIRRERHEQQYSRERNSEQDGVEHSLAQREELERLRHLVEQLPEDQRQVVRLRIHEELTFAVIAERLQLPLGTVLTRMRLAMDKLRKWLETADRGQGMSRGGNGDGKHVGERE